MKKGYSETKAYWVEKWRGQPEYADHLNRGKLIEFTKAMINGFSPLLEGAKSFCELGLGNGRNIHYFHEQFPDWKYQGNDINPAVHKAIRSQYPDVLEYTDIKINDTLEYLRACECADVIFSSDHLMHIPGSVIVEVCALMADKAQKFILLREAYSGFGQQNFRFERDYSKMFPGFSTIYKKYLTLANPNLRHGFYLFEKACK